MADLHSQVAPYALDALDQNEEREFEEHLAGCEDCREELAGLREAAARLAYAAPAVAPPLELKQRILAQAREERPNVVSLPSRRRDWTRPLAAVAAVAAAVAIGVGVWGATRSTSDPFASVLAKPGSQVVDLGGHGAVAVAPDGTAALALSAPEAPAGKTYEAWVINDGKAQRAGLLSGASTIQMERPVRPGTVVAVTLERAGGVDQPTNTPLAATKAVS